MKSLKLFSLRCLRATGLFALARYVTRDKVRILCYHGGQVGDEGGYNPLLFGSPKLIDERLRWLQVRGFTPLGIDVLNSEASMASIRGKRLPIIVTADDGWFSTISDVIEVCRSRSFPICVYVSTMQLLSGLPVVPVVLGYLLWKRRVEMLDARGTPVFDAMFGNRVFHFAIMQDKSEFLRLAIDYIDRNAFSREELVGLLERISALIGVDSEELNLSSRRFDLMTLDELRCQKRLGCSFQLHGHVHNYPLGDPVALEADVRECQEVLQGIGERAPWHYCYPSGVFDEHAMSVFPRNDVVTATTCFPGLVDLSVSSSNLYLPRFLDGENVSQVEFEAEMSGVMSALRWLLGRRRVHP